VDTLVVPVRPPVAAEPAPSGTARIGVLAPFSGPYARLGRDYLDGAQMALDAGAQRSVELLPADEKGTPVAAIQAVRRLDAEEKVSCMIGGFVPASTWVAAVEANSRGLPFLCNVLQESDLVAVGPHVFYEGASQTRAARAAADLAMLEMRLFRAALLFPEDGEGRTLAMEFAARMGELGGRVVASEAFREGTTDFVPFVRRLRAADPDVLYVPVKPETMLLVAPALAYQGNRALLMGPQSWNASRFLAQVGPDLEGAVIPDTEMTGDDRSALEHFDSLYRQRHREPAPRYATAGFLAMWRVLEASRGGMATERQELTSQLQSRLAIREANPVPFRFLVVRQGKLVPYPVP
jgi:branched-chain amino acid transport system substrate-binding protein